MRKVAFVIFTFIVVCMLGRLGFWQLSRAAEKLKLQQQIEETTQAEPISDITQLPSTPVWHNVAFTGVFDNQHPILLDNQLNNGQAGYHFYLPFLSQGQWILVNLGWIAAPPYRELYPVLPQFSGEKVITGLIAPTTSLLQLKPESSAVSWPLRVQNIEPVWLSQQLNRALPQWVVQIAATNPLALKQNWTPVVMKADKHYGYATQWFVLAFSVLGMAGWWLLRGNKE